MIQGQALTFVQKVATTRELQPSWEQAPILSTLSSYLRDEIPVLQFFSPSSISLKTEKSPTTTNKFKDPFASISTPSLSTVHAVPPPLKLSQPLVLLYLQCPFPRVSMYPTATDFYLTLFPLQTHTKKGNIFAANTFFPQLSPFPVLITSFQGQGHPFVKSPVQVSHPLHVLQLSRRKCDLL